MCFLENVTNSDSSSKKECNENDSVSVDELKFGDNDTLAGLLAAMSRSELTIILTTVGGLHHKENNILGERISVVENITDELYFPHSHSTHQASVGEPLNARFSLRRKF